MPEENQAVQMDAAKEEKEKGNAHFKEGRYADAAACYTKALQLAPDSGSETFVYLKNRAACHLKLENYTEAMKDCTEVLDKTATDPKALFRRCQALEALGSYESSYRDAVALIKVDPKNVTVQATLRRLNPIIQDKIAKQNSTGSKVTNMFELAFDEKVELEKRKQAMNNLVVLAREEAGSELICADGGVEKLIDVIQGATELQLPAIRVLAGLAGSSKNRALQLLDQVTLKTICTYVGSEDSGVSTAMGHVLQSIINSVTELDRLKADRDKYEAERKADPCSKMRPWAFVSDTIAEDMMAVVDKILMALIVMLGHGKVSGYGRDNAIELIIKFLTRQDGCGWAFKIVQAGGIQNILEVAGTIPEHKTLAVTANTRMHVSLCLSKIYDDLSSDRERDAYKEAVNHYFNDMFGDSIAESKLEAIMALAALLQGPIEVGNMILARQGVLEMLLTMANSGDFIHTKYAVEALVHSASKKDKCSGVIKQATPILKELYQSSNDAVKVRALVGLSKLGSFGGNDASAKSFADGSTKTLAKACRKMLCNAKKDVDIRKWAAEGLAYLTLDADVKEDLVNDTLAVNSLIDLAKIPDKGILYPVAQIFVNCTNSYDKPEVEPELIELAKFSKQHVPEEHEKDKEPYISERIKKLMKTGVVNALVLLSKTDSESSKELLSRVYLAVCMDVDHRGLVVQQGGAKALIPLANSGNLVGKAIAAQALAKITITTNPSIAFPGQRACEVVRPLLQLLDIEKTALQNFESLLALTNLASMNDVVRSRIVKERGVPLIEHYCYEEHELLRKAAVECICNLVVNDDVAALFKGENDRVKLLVLFSGEEDEGLVRAASGTLAVLSAEAEICLKITTCTNQWCDILKRLIVCETADIRHRGAHVARNMMAASEEVAAKMVASDLLELLMALSRLDEQQYAASRSCAQEALERAKQWGLIQAVPQ